MANDGKAGNLNAAIPRKRKAQSDLSNAVRRRFMAINTRKLNVQSQDEAFSNGGLNVAEFVRAREFEIVALENGIKSSSRALSSRAFQEVPRELRRRTASHNVKRVPKRLQARAQKEMRDDKTVVRRKRKILPQQRLRIENIRRMRAMTEHSKQKKAARMLKNTHKGVSITDTDIVVTNDDNDNDGAHAKMKSAQNIGTSVKVRKPKAKRNRLNQPPVPAARFRKRQVQKIWLPSHVFHAKRAHMCSPKEPLWRFAIPLTPTEKSYRKTHRATTMRGAIAWDTSYMSTIGVSGRESSIINLFKALSIGDYPADRHVWSQKGSRWRQGQRSWYGWLHKRQAYPEDAICPAYVMWQPSVMPSKHENEMAVDGSASPSMNREIYFRCHPSAFLELWRQLWQIAKVQKPALKIEDLRYEIGSISITGPQAAEAFAKILSPKATGTLNADSAQKSFWNVLPFITNTNLVPPNVMISTNISDPRLGSAKQTQSWRSLGASEASELVANTCAHWPFDTYTSSKPLFDRLARQRASKQLMTQKSVNKRRIAGTSGSTTITKSDDPVIPIEMYTSPHGNANQGSWTIMLPWKCLLAVWYPLMYATLSTGGRVRFGGLDEMRQIAHESHTPWYPADYPGTPAGQAWEARMSEQARKAYFRKPPGRRIAYESLDLGNGRRGEIGCGWACDWSVLAQEAVIMKHVPTSVAREGILKGASGIDFLPNGIVTVAVTMITRGVPQTRARIYRLPTTDKNLRRKWLAFASNKTDKGSNLPQVGSEDYPLVPDKQDLIGFITTGNFNLAAGIGTAIGSIVLAKMLESVFANDAEDAESKSNLDLCIVRNSGETFGRLARWRLAD